MNVDVLTEISIDRPVTEVFAFAADPTNAPTWYANIDTVEWQSQPPRPEEGSSVEFVARFLGRTLRYTYEIVELETDERLVMRTQQGPFPMETTYTWTAVSPHSTHMTLRNRGQPTGFSTLVAPLMQPAMRRANRKDLELLKRTLEN